MKIESLTAEQETRFPEFVGRWTQIGLSTEPADRPRSEAAVRDMYRQAGLAAAKKIVWCGSALSQLITCAIVLNSKRALPAEQNRCVGGGARRGPPITIEPLRRAQCRRFRAAAFLLPLP